jgi:hypothetical protein
MYKFSRCYVIVFTVFSFHLPNFDKNRSVFDKNRPKLAMPGFEKTDRFIGQTGCISVFLFSLFIFRAFQLNFPDF